MYIFRYRRCRESTYEYFAEPLRRRSKFSINDTAVAAAHFSLKVLRGRRTGPFAVSVYSTGDTAKTHCITLNDDFRVKTPVIKLKECCIPEGIVPVTIVEKC